MVKTTSSPGCIARAAVSTRSSSAALIGTTGATSTNTEVKQARLA